METILKLNLPTEKLRAYQLKLYSTFLGFLEGKNKISKYILPAGRRRGKDWWTMECFKQGTLRTRGEYVYIAPSITQATRIMRAEDAGKGVSKFDYHFPPEIVEHVDNKEHVVTLVNGSRITFGGVNNIRYRGTPLHGAAFTEAAHCDIKKLYTETIEPQLAETHGWMIAQSTPSGKNFFYELYQMAQENESGGWAYDIWDLKRTKGYYDEARIAESKALMIRTLGQDMGELVFQQEYNCSFDIGGVGQVYDEWLLSNAEKVVQYRPEYPLYAAFDIGYKDYMSCWVFQYISGEWYFIDSFEDRLKETSYYISMLKSRCPVQPEIILPTDATAQTVGSPTSVEDMFRNAGFHTMVVARSKPLDGINAVRRELPLIHIDSYTCQSGLKALRNYRYSWDDNKAVMSASPIHDEFSHFADAMRYAVAAKELIGTQTLNIPHTSRFFDIEYHDY